MKINPQELSLLGYTPKWIDYGIFSPEQLEADVTELQKDDGDPYIEHYRYRALMRYLFAKEEWSDEEISHVLEIASEDSDGGMAQSTLIELAQCSTLTDTQFCALSKHPLFRQFDVSRVYHRHNLLRSLKREGPTSQIIDRCVREGDSVVHRKLLEVEALTYSAVHALSTQGANKAIRNLANERLNSKRYKQMIRGE